MGDVVEFQDQPNRQSVARSHQAFVGLPAGLNTFPIEDTQAKRIEFAGMIAPALTLTAPVGMSSADKDAWYAAAWRSLCHLPEDLIKAGCEAAARSCDHPRQIVQAVISYAEPRLGDRQRAVNFGRPSGPALVAPGKSQCTAAEAAEILDKYGLRSKVNAAPDRSTPAEMKGGSDRPGKIPTAADYKRLFGIDVAPDAAA